MSSIQAELRKYEAEFVSGRMKVWPGILKSTTSGAAAGSLAAVGFSLIPDSRAARVMIGGIAGLSIAAITAGLDWTAERLRIEKSAAPPIADLSTVTSELG